MTSPHIQTGRVTASSHAPEGDYFLLVDDPESSRCHLLLFTDAVVVGGSRAWSLESSGNKPASDVAQRAGFTHGWWVPTTRVTLNDDAHLWREDRPAAPAEEEPWVPKPGDRVTVVRANPSYAQVNGAQATLVEDSASGEYRWKVEFSDEDWHRWSAQAPPEGELWPRKRLWVYEVAPPTEGEPEPSPEVAEVKTELYEIDRLRLELAEARGRVEAQEREHAEFRRTVGRVAMAKAREHNWCGVVREALDEMGVEVPDDRVSATLTITVKVSGLRSDHAQRGEERWFRNSLTSDSIEAALAEAKLLDSDWDEEDKAVYVASVVASDIEVYDSGN